ncbi:MAG: TIGR01244 family sulfur transferase [Sphingomonadaceae bacterium]
MFRKLDDAVLVAPQLAIDDVAEAARQGIVLIVNNRPDGEEPDAPQGDAIKAAARAAGLNYCAIPVTHAGFSGPQVDAMAHALDGARGPVLAYCRSGTRSTLLWALARTQLGDDKATLQAKAAEAGYDLTPIEALIDLLAKQR